MSGSYETTTDDTLALFDPDRPPAGKVGGTHPEASQRAAADLFLRRGWTTQRGVLLRRLQRRCPGTRTAGDGWTCADLAESLRGGQYPRIQNGTVAARLLELREAGLVAYVTGPDGVPVARAPYYDQDAAVGHPQRPTTAGLALLAEWAQ